MWGRNRKSSLMFLALAEFAWLVVFGSVFMFLQTSSTLRGVREDLRANKERLAEETIRREKFEQENKNLRNLVTNIDESLRALNTLRTNYNRLLATNQVLTEALAEKDRSLDEARSRQAQFQRDLERLQVANTELAESNLLLMQMNAELRRTNSALVATNRELEGRQEANSNLVARLQATNSQLEEVVSADVSIRRELTGLPPGELSNVVFVFDTSLSMKRSPGWKESVNLVRLWLEHLPVTECALVMFDDQVRPFPSSGGYQPIRDSKTRHMLPDKQKELIKWFDRCPSGNTSDLLAALSYVYRNLPSARHIIIFSDGRPQAVGDGISAQRTKIENLVMHHKDIPITCIGVNDYYKEPSAVTFLKTLSLKTKGTFMGR